MQRNTENAGEASLPSESLARCLHAKVAEAAAKSQPFLLLPFQEEFGRLVLLLDGQDQHYLQGDYGLRVTFWCFHPEHTR